MAARTVTLLILQKLEFNFFFFLTVGQHLLMRTVDYDAVVICVKHLPWCSFSGL